MTTVAPISTSFQAEWPKHLDPAQKHFFTKVWRVAWNVLSVVIFPIGLCRLAYWKMRDVALSFAIPGSIIRDPREGQYVLEEFNGTKIELNAPDGAKLEAAFFPGENRRDKAVIFGPGNAMQYETSQRYIHLLKQLGISVLVINPRGTGNSTGARYAEGFALDTYTGYEYLIQKEKVDPNDILHFGFSMGGGYGALGAAMVQKQYPEKKISAINYRSYGDLQAVAKGFAGRVSGCFGCLGSCILSCIPFRIPAKQALDTLKGRVAVVYNPSDGIISHSLSMAGAMRADPKRRVKLIEQHADPVVYAEAHLRGMDIPELEAIYSEVCKMLQLDFTETQITKFAIEHFQAMPENELVASSSNPVRVEQVG